MSSSQQQKKNIQQPYVSLAPVSLSFMAAAVKLGTMAMWPWLLCITTVAAGSEFPEVTTTVGRLRGISETCKKRVEDDPMVAIYRSTLW